MNKKATLLGTKFLYNFWSTLAKLNDWIGSWIETKFLDSTPGMREKIKRGMKTPLDKC